jgi:predicted site-specific integrase-resolvase
MKYFTTLEVAHQLGVSKQTLLNWLYARKVPEPPRNKSGYRLWSEARVKLVKDLIWEGRLHKRTVIYRKPTGRADVVSELAREVVQFLRDGSVKLEDFVKELRSAHRRKKAPGFARGNRRRTGKNRRKTGQRRRR